MTGIITRPKARTVVGIGLVLLLSCLGGKAAAQCTERQRLTPTAPGPNDQFGNSMAASGDTVVVGSWANDTAAGTDVGSAVVFRFDGTQWVEDQELFASDGKKNDKFGTSVASDGDVIVVGAPYAGSGAGAAYVFRFDGTKWAEEQKLTASDGLAGDLFGNAVAVKGDVVVVGAYADDTTSGVDAGSAYVYRYAGSILLWQEEQKLAATGAASGDQFGSAVAMDNQNEAFIGAYLDDAAGKLDNGSVRVFDFNGTQWSQVQALTASDAANADFFGAALAVDGQRLVVGAYLHDATVGIDVGQAYVFEDNGASWVETDKLSSADGRPSDQFGRSVSVHGNFILIGSPYDDEVFPDTGSAYLFRFVGGACGWVQDIKRTLSDKAGSDLLGFSVAQTDHGSLAGAHADDTSAGGDAGSVAVFDTAELLLEVTPTVVMSGQAITINTRCGVPDTPVMLAVTDVNGAPSFLIVLIRRFNADYEFTLSAKVPPGLAGLNITFQTFKQSDPCRGKALGSNEVTVSFQ
jgi:hypothetical protein